MISLEPFSELDLQTVEHDAGRLLRLLFPVCRSITGSGVRETLRAIQEETTIGITEVSSGTKCFDWTVPQEWVIRDAYINCEKGERLVDFADSNLHVVNYSKGIGPCRMSFEELRPHLHSLPELPDAIPYRTSYYQESWGFCLSDHQLQNLDRSKEYEVYIDAEHIDGSLSFGHSGLESKSKPKILFSTYCCHPSLANDNLSGLVLTTLLQSLLGRQNVNREVAFAYVPETIGALALLSEYQANLSELIGAFVVTCVAGPGDFSWKASFQGDSLLDRAVRQSFREMGIAPIEYDFAPDGSDERQYSSPGFRIPCVSVCRDKYYEYDFYHTSLDNLDFIQLSSLAESLSVYWNAFEKIDRNVYIKSKCPNGELQLGPRGLYPQLGGAHRQPAETERFEDRQVDVLSWLMFYADGITSLLEIAERTEFSFRDYLHGVRLLQEKGVIEISMEPL